MATLIAGRGGDRGIRGVAPESTILPVTVSRGFETGPGPEANADRFSRGIRYAADRDAIVVAGSGNTSSGELIFKWDAPANSVGALRRAAPSTARTRSRRRGG